MTEIMSELFLLQTSVYGLPNRVLNRFVASMCGSSFLALSLFLHLLALDEQVLYIGGEMSQSRERTTEKVPFSFYGCFISQLV